ncbi:MAG: M28 family peptidase [Thermoplasmata archaeon]
MAGSREDREVSIYISDEMRKLGLSDVTIEAFPVVNWNYRHASLKIVKPKVESPIIKTRSMAESPSTPDGKPICAELVHVGWGRKEDYEQIKGGVKGKIVLIEFSDLMWITPAVNEGAHQGAVGALIHNPFRDSAAINIDCAHAKIPTLSITGNDAAYLKQLLTEGVLEVETAVDNEITEDAPAHIVYGCIPGSEYPDEYVVFGAHYDHWWCGAVDNNGGVASTLAIAKAFLDARITPKRTMVFMASSGHESGTGGTKKSYWDWILGGHYFMNMLHPEWAGRIALSLITDGAGAILWGTELTMMIETTPELGNFLRKVANDIQVSRLMSPEVFTPVSSFDSWGFYAAGVPAATVYYGPLKGAFESPFYHTDLASTNKINPEFLRMDSAFRGVAGLRASQTKLLPFELNEIGREISEPLGKLSDKALEVNTSGLRRLVLAFETKAEEFQKRRGRYDSLSTAAARAINSKLLQCIKKINPLLWDLDIGVEYPMPGWCSVSKFDTYANDMSLLRDAIDALEARNAKLALDRLEHIATMDWGIHVSYPTYREIVWMFSETPYLHWAEDHLPPVTDVRMEYDAIYRKLNQHDLDFSSEIASLKAKLGVLSNKLAMIVSDMERAVDEGLGILNSIQTD